MGRPKIPLERKVVNRTVRLTPEVDDAVCRYALKHQISIYALLGRVVTRVFAKQINSPRTVIVYGSVTSSSRAPVVAARSSSGVRSSAGLG